MIVNLLSAFGLSVPAPVESSTLSTSEQERDTVPPNETTPLLPGAPAVVLDTLLAYSTPSRYSEGPASQPLPLLTLPEFLKAPSAWILGFVLFAAVGASEMVMSSIGSMVYSLQSVGTLLTQDDEIGRDTLIIRTRQVQLIAIANTASRLFVGIASDLLSPSRSKGHYNSQWKNYIYNLRISRVTLLLYGLALLGLTFLSAGLALNSVHYLWIVSISTGLGYGLIFTLIPTLIMRAWPRQFGRNFGILNYAAALGSLCFSMLFAFVNDYIAVDEDSLSAKKTPMTASNATCRQGRLCFAPSFLVASITLFIAFFITLPLWKAWRHAV
jgi:MFS family permease